MERRADSLDCLGYYNTTTDPECDWCKWRAPCRVVKERFVEIREVEDVPLETAKKRIKEHFEKHPGEILDFIDLMELDIPLPTMVKACRMLEWEGKLEGIFKKSDGV